MTATPTVGAGAVPTADDAPPPEAFAAAMAGLRRMGPARLTAMLAAVAPEEAWRRLCAGTAWDDAGVVQALGRAGDELIMAWRTAARDVDVAALWRRTVDLGVGVTPLGSPGYPAMLAADVEPPAVLFHQGDLGLLDGPRVAIVGTRRCSATGRGVAFELGRDLSAAGVAVVSGLAAGIDGAAHRGALAAGGASPIGVVGCGHDVVYPAHQHELWRSVAEVGLLLSEAPPGARPNAGASQPATASSPRSPTWSSSSSRTSAGGSLHTVDEADRRARDVFAVPGSVRNPAAAGTNALLAEGRAPACSADDVLVALDLGTGRRHRSTDARAEPDPADRDVLEQVGWEAATLDHLVVRTGRDLGSLAPALDRLCDAGWVSRAGGWYERVADQAADPMTDRVSAVTSQPIGTVTRMAWHLDEFSRSLTAVARRRPSRPTPATCGRSPPGRAGWASTAPAASTAGPCAATSRTWRRGARHAARSPAGRRRCAATSAGSCGPVASTTTPPPASAHPRVRRGCRGCSAPTSCVPCSTSASARRRRHRPRRPGRPTGRSSCVTPRCSSCCTAAGSASPRRRPSTSTRSTSPGLASWCGARAPSSAPSR